MASEVLMPSSPSEAVSLFGDGASTTVIGGGTVVMPEITYGHLTPERVLLLTNAGLDTVATDGDTITIGATTRVEALLGAGIDGLTACAGNVADGEIRSQATVGGNLCVGQGSGRARRPPGRPSGSRRNGPLDGPGRRAHGVT